MNYDMIKINYLLRETVPDFFLSFNIRHMDYRSSIRAPSGTLREATRDKKQLDFGFLLKGGGRRSNPNPKLSRNFSKKLF